MTHRAHRHRPPAPWIAAAAFAATLTGPGARAATLVGAQVSYAYHVNAGLNANLGTQTVADGTLFTDSKNDLTSFFVGNQLIIENTAALAFAGGAFNGPEFTFSGAIAQASNNAASSTDFTGVVGVSGATVSANYVGLNPASGSTQVIDLSADQPLAGQQVAYNYGFPNLDSFNNSLGAATLVPTTAFIDNKDGILVAVGANTITILNLVPLAFADASFNGPELTFAGVDLTGASIDPISSADFRGGLTTSAHGLSVNFAGFDPGVGHALVIDVAAISQVPEPAAWSLMIAGFGAAGAMLRARRAGRAQAPA